MSAFRTQNLTSVLDAPHVQQRCVPFEIKSLESAGEFSGYASTYNTDDHHDRIVPGAFSHTLRRWREQKRWPLLLWQHKMDEPIGTWHDMREDQNGLFVKGRLILEMSRARDAYTLIKQGVLDGLSIGFFVVVSKYDSQAGERKIFQLDLAEISVVTTPANPSATIHTLKSAQPLCRCAPPIGHIA
jgi:HK97 family phage prohead protease